MVSVWIHKKTGNKYFLVEEIRGKFGGVWQKAYIYANRDGMRFCRCATDFHEKFEIMALGGATSGDKNEK